MITYVALLRGINVGGHKKVPMAELRELLTKNKLQNVQTYIQSGNVVFQTPEKNINKIKEIIQESIKTHFKFEVAVLVKTEKEFQLIFKNCPFQDEKIKASYFILLESSPENKLKASVTKETFKDEEFIITDNCVYTYCSIGYGKAKCTTNFFERKLKTGATARNYNTMVKLLSLMK